MSVADDIYENIRVSFVYYLCLLLPILIVVSPIDPVKAAQEFSVFRLQHYDHQGQRIGSRNAAFNFEAQTPGGKSLARKCLLLKLIDCTAAVIRQAISQNVGGIVIIMPSDKWSEKLKEHFYNIENELLSDEYPIPIYFVHEDGSIKEIYNNVQQVTMSDQGNSAASAFINALWSTGYQLYIANPSNKPLPDHGIVNMHGKLSGGGLEDQLPTVIVVAHYDAFGAAPALSYGADANGSGVVVLLELVRIFSRLYSMSRTHAKFNLLFLLSGGGKLNYIGSKRWIEENAELSGGELSGLSSSSGASGSSESSNSGGAGGGTVGSAGPLLDTVVLVVCLEGLGSGRQLHMHVSKPPKEGSAGYRLYQHMAAAAAAIKQEENGSSPNLNPIAVEVVHKKINLNEDQLAWEHERFSIKKLPGLTLSAWPSPQAAPARRSILDREVDLASLAGNTRLIAEMLVRFLYNLTDLVPDGPVVPPVWITERSVGRLSELLTRYPRSAQTLPRQHLLLISLERFLRSHLQDVKLTHIRPDPKDPEFLFYDGTSFTMSAHKVKPVVFEFILACGIALYLGALYLLLENFSAVTVLLNLSARAGGTNKHKLT